MFTILALRRFIFQSSYKNSSFEKEYSTINYPKQSEPDVLNNFCAPGVKKFEI